MDEFLNFRHMVSPVIIKALFTLCFFATTVSCVALFVFTLLLGGSELLNGGESLLADVTFLEALLSSVFYLISAALFLLVVRICSEWAIVLFSMNESLSRIAANLEAQAEGR